MAKGYSQLASDGPKQSRFRKPKGGEIVGDGGMFSELAGMWAIAWPTMIAALMRSGTQQTTMILVGHLGVNELGAIAMGNMWVSVTGMMIVFGGMGALDTLCSQAYGAKNYKLVGLWAQRGLLIILCLCVPIFFLWFFTTSIVLQLIGNQKDNPRQHMMQGPFVTHCLWWHWQESMRRQRR